MLDQIQAWQRSTWKLGKLTLLQIAQINAVKSRSSDQFGNLPFSGRMIT